MTVKNRYYRKCPECNYHIIVTITDSEECIVESPKYQN